MIHCSSRKLALCGWLKENNPMAFFSSFRLQKFLFFYEALCQAKGEKSEFQGLNGYKRGPVFSAVWKDYTKESDFSVRADSAFEQNKDQIHEEIAQKASFLVSILSEEDLSNLTCKFHIWKCRSENINRGDSQQPLQEEDFDDHDMNMILMLDEMYPQNLIAESKILEIDDHYFILSKKDLYRYDETCEDYLKSIIESCTLNNPVFIEYDEDGSILLD